MLIIHSDSRGSLAAWFHTWDVKDLKKNNLGAVGKNVGKLIRKYLIILYIICTGPCLIHFAYQVLSSCIINIAVGLIFASSSVFPDSSAQQHNIPNAHVYKFRSSFTSFHQDSNSMWPPLFPLPLILIVSSEFPTLHPPEAESESQPCPTPAKPIPKK